MLFNKKLALKLLALSAIVLIELFLTQPQSRQSFSYAQNPYPECPPNSDSIWVSLDRYGGTYKWVNIPFDSGYDDTDIDGPDGPDVATGYINYLAGVLITEVGTTNSPPEEGLTVFDNKTLKAMAVLARSVAYHNCGVYDVAGHTGINDIKQAYDPIKATNYDDRQRYMNAVTAMDDVYISNNGVTFDVQYRTINDRFTDDYADPPSDPDGKNPPHRSIYDLPGEHHLPPSGDTPGLGQINANHYATGNGHGEFYPVWDYERLIAHSYTEVSFEDIYFPDAYRFNLLWFNNITDGPLLLRRGREYNLPAIVQNTGHNPWQLTPLSFCTPEYYESRYLALGTHWYNSDGTLALFEGSRTVLCADNGDQHYNTPTVLETGSEYPAQIRPQGNRQVFNAYVVTPNALQYGEYQLAFDMELKSPNPITWTSQLNNSLNLTCIPHIAERVMLQLREHGVSVVT